jgi:hypothetical protein
MAVAKVDVLKGGGPREGEKAQSADVRNKRE